MSLLFIFLTSLLLGMRHATDADHVVAVTAIVSGERSVRKAGGIGALWGVGHTLTILVVGGSIILFKLAFSARLGLSMEFTVAIMLVVLGLLNLVGVRPAPSPLSTIRPFFVGAVHGLAGSAAVTLLVLPLIDDLSWAVLYLVVFGLGTVVGMAFITVLIAAPSALAAAHLTSTHRWLRATSGAVSLASGLYLAHKVGFRDGLFTADPRWTPR